LRLRDPVARSPSESNALTRDRASGACQQIHSWSSIMSDEKPSRPLLSINDSLPSSNPSGRTVLIVLGFAVLGFFMLMLYTQFFQ
jgi:hypothetical protein